MNLLKLEDQFLTIFLSIFIVGRSQPSFSPLSYIRERGRAPAAFSIPKKVVFSDLMTVND